MCLFLSLLFLGPRAAIIVYWLGWPARWEVAFSTFIVPFAGFLFLPWTTLMYLLVAPGGVDGFDYLFIGLALLLDVASLTGGGVYGRRRGRQPAMS
ncbi:MAG TPA: hypothetical protein VFV00_16960 [Acidimicrobiales bacterium]|nr:hypothetical protein [Acidimicrobiales bacterium]